jgi:hypothetical protein
MMKLFRRYLTALSVTTAVLMLLVTLLPSPAEAGLGVAGAICEADVVPGESYIHKMTISSRETDPAMDILVDVRGLGMSPEGICQAVSASEDASPYSVRRFISLDKNSFHLEPGDSEEVMATIDIPEDVGAGGRYAVILVHTQPTGEGQIGAISAINTLVYLTIKDSQLVREGEITELTASEAISGQPIDIATVFDNTGNHHFKVKGEVTVKDTQGKVLDTIHIPVTPSSVVPSLPRQLKATFIPQGELPLGNYTVHSKVMLGDGSVLDEASDSFEVQEPYIPPPPVASITLSPNSPATLKTEDGRISISFPQGSVTGQVEVSVRSYPWAQLPQLPPELQLGSMCFRVDGLTGLLVEKATMTVKYTATDLDKAEGDASRLRLARWDEAQNEWSVLETKVDKETMILSTNTNRLGIWAIVIDSAAVTAGSSSEAKNWWPIIGGVAGFAVIVLLIYFLAVRRRAYQ